MHSFPMVSPIPMSSHTSSLTTPHPSKGGGADGGMILPSVTFDSHEFPNDNVMLDKERNEYEEATHEDDDESTTAFSLLDIDEYATQEGVLPVSGEEPMMNSISNMQFSSTMEMESNISPSMFFQKGSFHNHGFLQGENENQDFNMKPLASESSAVATTTRTAVMPLQPHKETNVLASLNEENKENIPPYTHLKNHSSRTHSKNSPKVIKSPKVDMTQQLQI